MCYHLSTFTDELGNAYEFHTNLQDYARLVKNDWPEAVYSRYHANGFSHPKLPTINSVGDFQFLSWGLVPHWAKDSAQAAISAKQCLNARNDGILEKPSFRDSIRKRRCLILVDGFYEWMEYKKEKIPHYITLADRKPFAFGGIWATWNNKATGETRTTCSIVTTEANPLMERIHNTKKRMPLILPKEHEEIWLNDAISDSDIKDLMQPLPEQYLEAHTISKLITSREEKTNVPEIKQVYQYPELQPAKDEKPLSLF